MQVVIMGRSDHSYQAALAAHRAGVLAAFHTFYYYFPDALRYKAAGAALPAAMWARWEKRLRARHVPGLPSTVIRPHPVPELLVRLMREVGLASHHTLASRLYDQLVASSLPPVDIFHGWAAYALVSARRARRLGAKVLVDMYTMHPSAIRKLLCPEYERFGLSFPLARLRNLSRCEAAMHEADTILVPSEMVRRSCIDGGVEAGRLRVIPFGVDTDCFSPAGEGTAVGFRVLFVGQLLLAKGVHYLLQACSSLEGVELCLVGRPAAEVAGLISTYQGRLLAPGMIPHPALPALYRSAAVFVLPSLVEGSALVIYEALACGIPVITTDNAGSVVRDGVEGYIVPIRDPQAIADRIRFLRDHPEVRTRMAVAARQRAEEHSRERYGQRLVALYRELAGEKER